MVSGVGEIKVKTDAGHKIKEVMMKVSVLLTLIVTLHLVRQNANRKTLIKGKSACFSFQQMAFKAPESEGNTPPDISNNILEESSKSRRDRIP